jgi:hypothetical protein
LTLAGTGGGIELTETNVRIISKNGKVREIPRDAITKVELAKALGKHQLHVHFPGAGLLGFVTIFIKEEQIPEAAKLIKLLTGVDTPIEVDPDVAAIAKILDRRGISPDRALTVFMPGGEWIVLTDDGVLVVTRKLGFEQYFPYKSITTVQFKEPGLTLGLIKFTLIDGQSPFFLFSKNELEILRKVRIIVEEKQGRSVPMSPASSGTSKADELTKLAALKRDGSITEEEYAQLKKDLLSNR